MIAAWGVKMDGFRYGYTAPTFSVNKPMLRDETDVKPAERKPTNCFHISLIYRHHNTEIDLNLLYIINTIMYFQKETKIVLYTHD